MGGEPHDDGSPERAIRVPITAMHRAFNDAWDQAHAHHVSLRNGAYFLAIERVAEATMDRGIYL